MVGSGFVLFAGALIQANQSLPFTIGLAVILLPTAVLPHLVLAFPDGHLHSELGAHPRRQRLLQRDRGSDLDAHVHGHRAGRRLPLPAQSPVRPRQHGCPFRADGHRVVRHALDRNRGCRHTRPSLAACLSAPPAGSASHPRNRRCRQRALCGHARRRGAALPGGADQPASSGACGVRLGSARVSARAVPRTSSPRRSQRPDRRTQPTASSPDSCERHSRAHFETPHSNSDTGCRTAASTSTSMVDRSPSIRRMGDR